MKGYLVVNSFLKSNKFEELYSYFLKAAKEQNITLTLKRGDELMGPLGMKMEDKPDFALFFDKDVILASILEENGVRCFNTSRAILLCDDKALTARALVSSNIPTPKTYIAPKTFTNIGYTDFSFLNSVEKQFSYPFVIKERFGSFGFQVHLAHDRREAEEILTSSKGNEVIIQEFISESSGRDVRMNVVGNDICGMMLRYNENDFRSNITNGGSMANFDAPNEFKEVALAAAKAVHADFAGVDVLFGKDGPLVCEVNSNPHFKSTLLATKVDLSKEIISYIKRSLS